MRQLSGRRSDPDRCAAACPNGRPATAGLPGMSRLKPRVVSVMAYGLGGTVF